MEPGFVPLSRPRRLAPTDTRYLPMPRSVRDLHQALLELPPLGDAARLPAVDHLAARVVSALARFADAPASLVPAQRALLLIGGRPGPSDDSVDGLLSALKQVDIGLGDRGGFSRLLESALEAGDVHYVQRLTPADLPDELQDMGASLEQLAAGLGATDDLSHATASPPALVAGAQLACWLGSVLAARDRLDDEERLEHLQNWLAHRGAAPQLRVLVAYEPALGGIDDEVVDLAVDAGLARPLALWILSERLSAGDGLDAGDRAPLERLLKTAGLFPLDVFERGL
jgi:hypothetical protein